MLDHEYGQTSDKAREPEDYRKVRRSQNRGSLLLRAALWSAISLGFLVWNLWRIFQFRAAGLPVRWWAYVQVALWLAALGFWLWMGRRGLERKEFKQK